MGVLLCSRGGAAAGTSSGGGLHTGERERGRGPASGGSGREREKESHGPREKKRGEHGPTVDVRCELSLVTDSKGGTTGPTGRHCRPAHNSRFMLHSILLSKSQI